MYCIDEDLSPVIHKMLGVSEPITVYILVCNQTEFVMLREVLQSTYNALNSKDDTKGLSDREADIFATVGDWCDDLKEYRP